MKSDRLIIFVTSCHFHQSYKHHYLNFDKDYTITDTIFPADDDSFKRYSFILPFV